MSMIHTANIWIRWYQHRSAYQFTDRAWWNGLYNFRARMYDTSAAIFYAQILQIKIFEVWICGGNPVILINPQGENMTISNSRHGCRSNDSRRTIWKWWKECAVCPNQFNALLLPLRKNKKWIYTLNSKKEYSMGTNSKETEDGSGIMN